MAEFLEGSWDVPLVYRFFTVIVVFWLLLKLEEKAILCLIVAQGRGAIFLKPKEPLTIDLLIHFNAEEERKAEEKEHPKPELGQR